MPPDLNSLPPSRSMSSSPMQSRSIAASPPIRRDTPSPRPSSVSLAAAATLNATDISRHSSTSNNNNNNRGSPRLGRASERRRSQVAMNLNLNDPALPGPGELSSSDHRSSIGHSFMAASPSSLGGSSTIATGDPHHHQRTPSLGEIHQELEQEQEAQVNRLLQMIRTQQLQLEQMQRYQQDHHSRHSSQASSAHPANHPATTTTNAAANNTSAIDDLTPASEQSFSLLPTTYPVPPPPQAIPRGASHRRPSRGHTSTSPSPALRPHHLAHDAFHSPTGVVGGDNNNSSSSTTWPPLVSLETAAARRNSGLLRDESAYYQAETASLTRENQMLRLRIRELERQLADTTSPSTAATTSANVPSTPSNLILATTVAAGAGAEEQAAGGGGEGQETEREREKDKEN